MNIELAINTRTSIGSCYFNLEKNSHRRNDYCLVDSLWGFWGFKRYRLFGRDHNEKGPSVKSKSRGVIKFVYHIEGEVLTKEQWEVKRRRCE